MTDSPTPVNPQVPGVKQVLDELFWMRKELEEFREVIYDHTVLIARLAVVIDHQSDRIEEWVGVAES